MVLTERQQRAKEFFKINTNSFIYTEPNENNIITYWCYINTYDWKEVNDMYLTYYGNLNIRFINIIVK